MKTIPKELTPELLSLVVGEEVKGLYVQAHNNVVEYGNKGMNGCYSLEYSLNLDTLTRLMKEWCYDEGYCIETKFNYPLQAVVIYPIYSDVEVETEDGFGIGETELEVVIKATHFIAKEKGYIK